MKRYQGRVPPTSTATTAKKYPNQQQKQNLTNQDEISALQELVNNLRHQLSDLQSQPVVRREKENVIRMTESSISSSSAMEMELIRTQKQLSDMLMQNKDLYDIKTVLENKLHQTQNSNHELSKELQRLMKELDLEKSRNSDAIFAISQVENLKISLSETTRLLEDARNERDEIQQLFQNSIKNIDFLSALKENPPTGDDKSKVLHDEIRRLKDEKLKLLQEIETLKDNIDERDSRLSLIHSQHDVFGEHIDDMKSWMEFLNSEMKSNKFSITDLIDAIKMLNRERNLSNFHDFLKKILKSNDDNLKLKSDLLSAMQELDKTKKLLKIQEGISSEYKNQLFKHRLLETEATNHGDNLKQSSNVFEFTAIELIASLDSFLGLCDVSISERPTLTLFLVFLADEMQPMISPSWLWKHERKKLALKLDFENVNGMKILLYASFGLENWLVGSALWKYDEIFSEVVPALKIFHHEEESKLLSKIYVKRVINGGGSVSK